VVKLLRVLAWPAGDPGELNPYVRRMYEAFQPPEAQVFAFRPLMRHVPDVDIMHVHWPEGIFEGKGGKSPLIAAGKAFRVLSAAKHVKRLGGKLVLTAHNVAPHLPLTGWRKLLWRVYFRRFLAQVDHIIGLSQTSLHSYRAAYPVIANTPSTIIVHPHYRDDYHIVERQVAREAWKIPSDMWILGLVGSLRRSKNLVEAAEAFLAIRRPDESLFIAGSSDEDDIATSLVGLAAGAFNAIHLEFGRLDDQKFAAAIAVCNACLINQATTLNSGTALVTLSLDRPLVAPSVGTLPSLAADVGGEWVKLFALPLTPAKLRQCIDMLRWSAPIGRPSLDHLDPAHLSRVMLDVFKTISC
jgi:beta-1,4-mannosyltransferase